ncbi:MAG: hypothetical protein GX557_02535, partial [Chloroflexi bacterium]|nr:hypothetical protein [Chloroflexota bacterium]
MYRWHRPLAALAVCLALLIVPSSAAQTPPPSTEPGSSSPAPLIIANVGQWDSGARFQVWGGPGTTWLAKDEIWISLLEPAPSEEHGDLLGPLKGEEPRETAPRQGVNLRLSFEGANPHPKLEPFGPSETVVSYFYGNDPDKWCPDVPVWTGVRYVDLYPGLDLEIGGAAGGWGWRMVAKEAGTPGQSTGPGEYSRRGSVSLQDVRLRVEGAERVSLGQGTLHLQTAVGEVTLPLLQAADAAGGALELRTDGPQVEAEGVSAPFASPPATRPGSAPAATGLVFSTYLGGSGPDEGSGIAVDGAGQVYVTGTTASTDLPTTVGAFKTSHNEGYYDAYVGMLSAAGAALVYCSFLGGDSNDYGGRIAVDAAGQAHVVGSTGSANYPTTSGGFSTTFSGMTDVFVTVLNPTGSALVYSSFLGGSGIDNHGDIELDGTGRAYIVGSTQSGDYPVTSGAFDPTHSGTWEPDVFVSALNVAGSGLIYSTFLGGSNLDCGLSIALAASGQAFLTGYTTSPDFPNTPEAYDSSYGGTIDAFVAMLNPSGTDLVYSTFLGSTGDDSGLAITVDQVGRAYVTGTTVSPGFPTTPRAFDTTMNGNHDGFVVVLEQDGSNLIWSTFLGGGDSDWGLGIAVDVNGKVYVTGKTWALDYPTTP